MGISHLKPHCTCRYNVHIQGVPLLLLPSFPRRGQLPLDRVPGCRGSENLCVLKGEDTAFLLQAKESKIQWFFGSGHLLFFYFPSRIVLLTMRSDFCAMPTSLACLVLILHHPGNQSQPLLAKEHIRNTVMPLSSWQSPLEQLKCRQAEKTSFGKNKSLNGCIFIPLLFLHRA